MLSREKLDEIRVKGEFKIEGLETKTKVIAEREAAKIQEKGQILSNKIRELVRMKMEILKSPRPKTDMREIAMKSYRENKERAFSEFLVPLLKICQEHRWNSLFEDHVRLPIDPLKFAFAIFSEDEIKRAVEALPDEGRTKKEIEADIIKVDEEIAEIEAQI